MKNMALDEVLVYDRALSFPEVKALDNSYRASLPPQLLLQKVDERGSFARIAVPPTATDISVYPNPTTGTLSIKSEKTQEFIFVSLINPAGVEILRIIPNSNTIKIPASVAPGLYLLKIQTKDGRSYIRKITLNR
jgi:hypothetical protein